MRPDYSIGLDLGQASDFTALAVLECRPAGDPGGPGKPAYALRHLQRFPLGTPYTEIVPAVTRLAGREPLRGSPLVVDQTGVGRAVVDLLRREAADARIIPVTITGGHAVTGGADGSLHVPKKELVTCLQVVLQGRRLRVARDLPEADTLVRELENYRVRVTESANETFGPWREGQHDDLVLALGLAVWHRERSGPTLAPAVLPDRGRRLPERFWPGRESPQRCGLFGRPRR